MEQGLHEEVTNLHMATTFFGLEHVAHRFAVFIEARKKSVPFVHFPVFGILEYVFVWSVFVVRIKSIVFPCLRTLRSDVPFTLPIGKMNAKDIIIGFAFNLK